MAERRPSARSRSVGHSQTRKSAEWFDNSSAAVKKMTSQVSYDDLERGDGKADAQARDADAQDDTAVLEKDLSRLVPDTVSDPALRHLLFGANPTNERIASNVAAIRDLIRRFLQIRLRPGYAQGMHMVAALLLAKMRPEKALWVFVSIVEDVMPIDFYSKPPAAMQGFRVETELIVRLTVLMFPEMNDFGENVDDSNLSVAVRMLAAKILVPLFVDVCSLEVTEAIWDRLLAAPSPSRAAAAAAGGLLVDTSKGAAGATIFIHVILAIVATARPHMDRGMRSTAIYQLLLDTVGGLTAAALPGLLGAVDSAFLDPHVIRKYRVKARQQLSARWIEHPDRLRKMVRQDDVHFGLALLEQLRETFGAVSEGTGVISEAMLRKVLRKAVEQGQDLPLPLKTFCDGVVRLHATTDDGIAVAAAAKRMSLGHGRSGAGAGGGGHGSGGGSGGGGSRGASVTDMNFHELVSILSIALRGTFAQKLRLCFDIFNTTNSGYLKLAEADRMIRAVLRVPTTDEEEEQLMALQTNYVPPSFDDRHVAAFFPHAKKKEEEKRRRAAAAATAAGRRASSAAGAGGESAIGLLAEALHSCAVRFTESLRDVAEDTAEVFASPDKHATSRHALSLFTFSEVYDVAKLEPLVRTALGVTDDDGEFGGGAGGNDSSSSSSSSSSNGHAHATAMASGNAPQKRIATDSVIVRSMKAASPSGTQAPFGVGLAHDNGTTEVDPRAGPETALIAPSETGKNSRLTARCTDCCIVS